LGQKRTCAAQKVMSALPPKADMCSAQANGRAVALWRFQAMASVFESFIAAP
jgi:hypothetical protein